MIAVWEWIKRWWAERTAYQEVRGLSDAIIRAIAESEDDT